MPPCLHVVINISYGTLIGKHVIFRMLNHALAVTLVTLVILENSISNLIVIVFVCQCVR